MYDLYFWWKGWEKKIGVLYTSYNKSTVYVYPPTLSRRWVVIFGEHGPTHAVRTFGEVRLLLKEKGLL